VALKMPRAEYCDFVLLALSQRRFSVLKPHCDLPLTWKFRAADGYRYAQPMRPDPSQKPAQTKP